MAINTTIGGGGTLFHGEDKQLSLELLDASSLPVDMSGWVIQFIVRNTDKASDPAIFSVTASLTGVYNAVRATNTQRAVVQLTFAQMETVTNKTYRHSWKRLDNGNETVLAYGNFTVEYATNH